MSESRKEYVIDPCPFCAGPPCLDVKIINAKDFSWYEGEVWCHDCGAKVYSDVEDAVTIDAEAKIEAQVDAINRWNRRGYTALSCYELDRCTVFFDADGNEHSLADEKRGAL